MDSKINTNEHVPVVANKNVNNNISIEKSDMVYTPGKNNLSGNIILRHDDNITEDVLIEFMVISTKDNRCVFNDVQKLQFNNGVNKLENMIIHPDSNTDDSLKIKINDLK